MKLIKALKKKRCCANVSDFGSTLSTILKNRQTIVKNKVNFGPKQKKVRLCQYDVLDKAMLKWVRGIRDRNFPISETLMQERAVKFAKTLGYPDFKASAGWLD
ncbi:hypothetical protein AVEN_84846-1 [Araneus ventricosus]|uniref:HTH CENPB-type domain-containing protein n=1 Tax=Araneus ventricosus TaxID=182803 RepID=A0A4Y2T7J5_ARAVE|nr:hypothetical protein AVEN_84846-1 [Araneus ventricosus]